MVRFSEYKGLTIEQILNFTGLENQYTDQTKYSLARQRELLLLEAKKKDLIHLVPKTNPYKHFAKHLNIDNGLVITKLREIEKVEYTNKLDLTKIPTKVVKETNRITIYIKRSDIPENVTKLPGTDYYYNVIGHFESHKANYKGTEHQMINGKLELVSTTFRINTNKYNGGILIVILE